MTEIDRNPEGVLAMILNMQKMYTKYLNQANKVDKQNDKIRIRALGLE